MPDLLGGLGAGIGFFLNSFLPKTIEQDDNVPSRSELQIKMVTEHSISYDASVINYKI
jgi:hypothetical protein